MANVNFAAFTVFASLIGTCGVILNFLVCLLYISNPALLDAGNIFILNISCGDLLYSLMALPLLVTSNAKGRWSFGEGGCTTYGFLTTFFALGSMMHLAGAAYERYFTFNKLLSNGERKLNKSKTVRLCALLWAYAFFWSVVPVFGWSSYVQEGVGTSCAVNWRSSHTADVSYALFLIVACFVLPVAVIIYCYYKSYNALCRLGDIAKENWGEESRVTQETIRAERAMAKVIATVTIGFVLAWTPYTVVSLMSMFGPELVSDVGASLPAYIAKSSSCYNPIIYVFAYEKFRANLKSLLGCKKIQVDPEAATGKVTHQKSDRAVTKYQQSAEEDAEEDAASGGDIVNLRPIEVGAYTVLI